jgi:hypothetical protein
MADKIMKKTNEAKTPPLKRQESLQMTMFSQFVSNEEADVSNTIEIWESIPKYFLTGKQMIKLRVATGHADPYELKYSYNDREFTSVIQPALIKQEDGSYKAFFPSVSEELIEEVLKKIFTEQNLGFHEVQTTESWVRFSLRMIYKELKARGRTRSIQEIKHSIDVMSKCHITVMDLQEKEIYNGAILSDVVRVKRSDYYEDSDAHCMARFPVFVSNAINSLQYRQFNYGRYMECREQLTRWLYKRLVVRYRQASISNEYHFMFSDIKQSSGLLGNLKAELTPQMARKKTIAALNELVQQNVIFSNFHVDQRKDGKTITDIKYTVRATPEFVRDQKAANKRSSDDQMKALQSGLPLPR